MLVLRLFAVLLLLGPVPALAAPSAPAFSVTLLDGSGKFESRSALGKKVLIVRFQASWCKVCAQEAPAIQRLYVSYNPSGVELVAIHVQDTAEDARRFLKGDGATYPAGLDPHLSIANRFGFKGTPYTVVIDKKGEMVARIHGRADDKRLSSVLDPLLKPRPKRPPPARLQ